MYNIKNKFKILALSVIGLVSFSSFAALPKQRSIEVPHPISSDVVQIDSTKIDISPEIQNIKNKLYNQVSCKQGCNSLDSITITDFSQKNSQFNIEANLIIDSNQHSFYKLPFFTNEVSIVGITNNQKSFHGLLNIDNNYILYTPPGKNNFNLKLKTNTNKINLGKNFNHLNILDNISSKVMYQKENEDFFILLTNVNEVKPIEVKVEEVEEDSHKTILNHFYLLKRELVLSDKWELRTTLSPIYNYKTILPTEIKIPLLKGEKVLSDFINHENGFVNLTLNNQTIRWESEVDVNHFIEFKSSNIVTDKVHIGEELNIFIKNNWLIDNYTKNPYEKNSNSNFKNIYKWYLTENEKININLKLPTAIEGKFNAVKNYSYVLNEEKMEEVVKFSIESSVGGNYIIKFKDSHKSDFIYLNNEKLNIKIENNQLNLPLNPGVNDISINFKKTEFNSFFWKPIEIEFQDNSINNVFTLNVKKRFILFTGGGDIRPTVITLGWIVFLLAIFTLLYKTKLIEEKPAYLSFVLFGFITSNIVSLMFVLSWLALVKYKNENVNTDNQNYNFFSYGIIAFGLLGLISIIEIISSNLLHTPYSQIIGYNSSNMSLSWFSHVYDLNNSPFVISVSQTAYQIVMFVWAFFISFMLLNWISKTWKVLNKDGFLFLKNK